MNSALDQVRTVLGDEDASGLSDQTLRDSLWEYFFDVEKTIQWAIGWSICSNLTGIVLKCFP